jgi:hypothetical protein
MPLGNFTRPNIEAEACEIAKNILSLFDQAEKLRSRCAAELAAGTLDSPGFYQGDATDKANILGALDDMHTIHGAIGGAALPQLDYTRYINFLIGI